MKKKKSHLPFRLNIIFFLIFMLFSLLVVQLGIVQILTGEEAQNIIDATDETVTMHPVPRGKMYDRNGNLILDNVPRYAITYTPPKNVQPKEKLEIAQTLAKYIEMKIKEVVDGEEKYITIPNRDLKDYFILTRPEQADNKLTEKEKEELDNEEEYQTILDRITDEELEFSDEELEVIAIKRKLDLAVEFTPYIVKNEDVTEEEYAIVAEHLSEMPGINVTIDWQRDLKYGSTFANFIGGLTDYEIPQDQLDYYLARDYSLNDRVGESFLEKQYETVLSGQKEVYRYVTDKQNNVIGTELVREGEPGKDLVLTIDMELQKKVDEIVEEELKNTIESNPQRNQYLQDAFVVMMNPKTGEILAMSGKRFYRKGEDPDRPEPHFKDESYRTVYDAHLPGSAVKGATVLAGFESGLINKSTRFYDKRIKISGTPSKGSYNDLGSVNYSEALEKSSNVFMFYIALRMGGEFRHPLPYEAKVTYDSKAFTQMRNYFKQFGLGVETGIDLPYEATGIKGDESLAGFLMDYTIGQYEPFTTLQLAQYVSTIANDGYRIRPHLVKEIRNPSNSDELGTLYQSIQPEVLNKIEMDEEYIEAVQHGFYLVTHGQHGTARGLSGLPYDLAAKTGTAEHIIYENGEKIAETENLTFVGYAPYDDPEVAFAVVVPKVGKEAGNSINQNIGRRIMDAYFGLEE